MINTQARELWSEKLERRDHLENLSADGRIVLKWIVMKVGEEVMHS